MPPGKRLLAASGDIEVPNGELRNSIDPLGSPRRTLAATALCEPLNQTAPLDTLARATNRNFFLSTPVAPPHSTIPRRGVPRYEA
jgi:hypothetical protein